VVLQDGRKGTVDFQTRKKCRVVFDDGVLKQNKTVRKGRVHLATLHTEEIKLERMRQLKEILESQELKKASVIVFCRTRGVAQEVWEFLSEFFAETALCHGMQPESYRRMNVARLREGKADVLVATDLASRGLDLPDVTHVINFELPTQVDDFVHRCGRCGRIGKQGMAISFITGRELMFNSLRRTLGQNMRLPKWFNLTGMQQAWRNRKDKLPFSKERSVLDPKSSSTPEEREGYLLKQRDNFLKYQIRRTRKMTMLERGEMEYENDEEESDEMVVRVDENDPMYDEEVGADNFL